RRPQPRVTTMNHTTETAAAEKAAFIKTAFDGSDDPGNDNASRVKAGAEAFSKADASAEASKVDNSTETADKASENALIAANLSPPDFFASSSTEPAPAEITVFRSDSKTLSK